MSPEVAYGAGNYLVVWSDNRESGTNIIYAARVTVAGKVIDKDGILVGVSKSSYQNYPSVIFDGSKFFVVWATQNPNAIYGRFFYNNGALGDTIRICALNKSATGLRIAYDQTNFFIVWNEYLTAYLIKGQIVSKEGLAVSKLFTIADSVPYSSIGLCFDGENYLVTWNNKQIWGRKYSRTGKPIGASFKISKSTNQQAYCDIGVGSDKHCLIVWAETINSTTDIYGNLDLVIKESKGKKKK